jgi:hypothetical protein
MKVLKEYMPLGVGIVWITNVRTTIVQTPIVLMPIVWTPIVWTPIVQAPIVWIPIVHKHFILNIQVKVFYIQ